MTESSRDLVESKDDLAESDGDLMESNRGWTEFISHPQLGPCKPPCSLRVLIDGSSFEVDRALLAEHCEYFRALFQSGMRESLQDQIQLRCVGGLGFLVLLRVLDGERPSLNSDQIVETIECAAFLQAPALTKHLISVIDSDNCLLMYHTASTFGVWDLSHSSALFIRDLYPDLQEELQSFPRTLVDYIESLQPRSYVAVCSHSPSSELMRDEQRTLCYLDESSRDWRVLTHLPVSSSTTMAGLAVLDNKLYIMGGVHDVSKKVVETGFCYCPEGDTWTMVPGPRELRYNFTLIGHDGCLYALGGESNMRMLSFVEKFTVSDGTWSSVSPLPSPATSVVSAITMNRIFICLWRGQGATDIHEYQPEHDRWLLVATLVRQNSYGLHMVAHKDNLYVMRNGPCEDFLQCMMDRYSLSSGQWTAMLGLYGNSKSSLFTAVVRGDSVFTLSRQTTMEFAIEDQTWRLKRQMKGFGRIGSIYTFLLRLPKTRTAVPEKSVDQNKNRIFRDIRSHLRISPQCPDGT